MDLKELRDKIDEIDDEMARLFVERARVASEVAEYKRLHNMSIMQAGREEEVLQKACADIPGPLKDGGRLFFTTLMDISKCRQQQLLTEAVPYSIAEEKKDPVVGAVTRGSYTADACTKFCGDDVKINYYRDFAEVFEAVENGEIDYGVLPIQNSTAGIVGATYDLMLRHKFYICRSTMIPINHVLAAKKGTRLSDIRVVTSHEMALKQCSKSLQERKYAVLEESSTAKAAERVAASDDKSGIRSCMQDHSWHA